MSEYVYDMSDARNPLREEIVRCRDCESMRDWLEEERMGFDDADFTDGWCMFLRMGVDCDGFCAWAERKVDE